MSTLAHFSPRIMRSSHWPTTNRSWVGQWEFSSELVSKLTRQQQEIKHFLFISNSFLLTLAVFCIVPAFFIAAFLATGFLADAGRFRNERAPLGLLTVPNAFAENHIKN